MAEAKKVNDTANRFTQSAIRTGKSARTAPTLLHTEAAAEESGEGVRMATAVAVGAGQVVTWGEGGGGGGRLARRLRLSDREGGQVALDRG
jgi:hypothetical protein